MKGSIMICLGYVVVAMDFGSPRVKRSALRGETNAEGLMLKVETLKKLGVMAGKDIGICY